MSKKEQKREKLYFKQAHSAYHAGEVADVPAAMAKEFKKKGIARPATQTLPNDLPGRDAFLEAGIESVDEIREMEDPTEVNGIGDATAKELAEYLAEK